ncbi:hypothetical protein WMY93_007509 [Mugilogobius chulae]|uniref:L1 transposable element RRM domain-containing protein n=1 Tax=Mugilogobius chulae TaxID=88201 RepID=A0AAW0PRU4_9GOBI
MQSSSQTKKEETKRKARDFDKQENMFEHSYADVNNFETLEIDADFAPLPDTPINSPAPKKACSGDTEPSLRSILKAVNDRADEVKILITQNSEDIKEIKTSITFLHEEVDDIKKQNKARQIKCEKFENDIEKLQERVADAERYKRRWCLRLYGVPEHDQENVKEKVTTICQKVVPLLGSKVAGGIDVVHRLGRRDGNKSRGIIILFALRTLRDEVWRNAKTNAYLRENKLRFGEDLTKEDKDARAALWPIIEKARQDGKKAYYVGRKGYVDGKEVRHAS